MKLSPERKRTIANALKGIEEITVKNNLDADVMGHAYNAVAKLGEEPSEDFADYPTSVSEAKGCQSFNATDWVPRDALINMLRDIDDGTIKPIAAIAIICDEDENGVIGTRFSNAGPNLITTLGMLSQITYKLQNS